MSSTPEKPFSPWRESLWPIHDYEMKKFMPMVVIMFSVLFNYTLVRNIKDTLVLNAPCADKDVINWLKFFFVVPSSILFVVLYSKLSNTLSRARLYFSCLIPFGIFFGLYALVIYPNHEHLNMAPATIEALQKSWPVSMKYFWPALGNWVFSLFYVMAEMWGNVAIALLFWQFANQITRPSEAKRFYPLFGFWSNLGLVCAGALSYYSEEILGIQDPADSNFQMQLNMYMAAVVCFIVLIGVIYAWMGRNVLTDPRYYDEASLAKKGKEKKPKLSVGESFKYIFRSKYIGYIAILVLAYGITINIVEVTWKGQVKAYYHQLLGHHGKEAVSAAYNKYMELVFLYLGLSTMFFIMFSKNMVRKLGWKFSAALTPMVVLVTGSIFYAFIIFEHQLGWIAALFGVTPIFIAMTVGTIQGVISKGVKYALFDPTREMTYIPLDEELKIKGKAAVDVIGGRLGKSGGSVIQMVLPFFIASSLITPALFVVLVTLSLGWLGAVNGLNTLYQAKLREYEKDPAHR